MAAALGVAQSGTSTISGSIADATGSAIPVTNEQTGAAQATLTNEAGAFRAVSLLPGVYRVEVEAEGFQKLVRRPIGLEVGQVVALDLQLELGKATETVMVTEAGPITDSQTSNVGQVVNRQMLAGLPLPNRAASSLALLAPGVVMIDTGGRARRRTTRYSASPEAARGIRTSRWMGETFRTRSG